MLTTQKVSTPNVKEALRVPLVQAQAKIKAQIDEGIKIKKSSAEITNQEKFDTVKADFQKWLKCTRVVLEQIFVTDKNASELVDGELAIIAQLNDFPLLTASEHLQQAIRRACNQLDSIYETLPHYGVASVGAGLVDVLLVTATDVETLAVLDWAKANNRKENNRDVQPYYGDRTYYELGTIGGAKTFMVRSETGSGGPGGSLATTKTAIEELKPWAVIAVGIAFGVNSQKQQIGDILISETMYDYGGTWRVGTDSLGQPKTISRVLHVPSSPKLLGRFRDGILAWKEKEKIRLGPILSGPNLVDNIDYRNELLKLQPEAIGGDMEGSGLFGAAYNCNVDWIVVKAICDFADGKKHEDKEARQQEAARNAASFVFFVLERGGLARGGSASPINNQ